MIGSSDEFQSKLSMYFACESTGMNAGKECDRSDFENADTAKLFVIPFTILLVYPIVIGLYVLNLKEVKKCWNYCCQRTH